MVNPIPRGFAETSARDGFIRQRALQAQAAAGCLKRGTAKRSLHPREARLRFARSLPGAPARLVAESVTSVKITHQIIMTRAADRAEGLSGITTSERGGAQDDREVRRNRNCNKVWDILVMTSEKAVR
jgi:hypothetical protein